ncbi:DUF4189 domain-containing protein [Xanthomonas theicola]|uniref:DUF4189 domain-containing protein n=1 Tax=Xanthomonas theicola TaxID=56464 RepID=UPI0036107769
MEVRIKFIFIFFTLWAGVAHSQTRCPTGVQAGSAQCLPDAEEVSPPRPTGEWIKTWGAIANAVDTSKAWASIGMMSEKDARVDALDQCQSAGYKGCVVIITYRNQCVAMASPASGDGDSGMASAQDISIAKKNAINMCKKMEAQNAL